MCTYGALTSTVLLFKHVLIVQTNGFHCDSSMPDCIYFNSIHYPLVFFYPFHLAKFLFYFYFFGQSLIPSKTPLPRGGWESMAYLLLEHLVCARPGTGTEDTESVITPSPICLGRTFNAQTRFYSDYFVSIHSDHSLVGEELWL